MALLHVLLAVPGSIREADDLLRTARHALPRTSDGRCILLFCDLPDAAAMRMPEDDALIRRLQSGVMSIERRRPGEILLLVRRRVWDPAARLFLGKYQLTPARQVIAQLLSEGCTDAVFEAASFTPGSLRGRFAHILLADSALCCTPDVPTRMAKLLPEGSGSVCARVRCMPQDEPPLLAHLIAQGFTLAPGQRAVIPPPVLFTPEALASDTLAAESDCVFALRRPPAMRELLRRAHADALRGPIRPALLPIGQVAALLLAAMLGSPLFALAAVLIPEIASLRRPIRLPSALARTALLPLRAAASLDALLMRLFSSARLRVVLPRAAQGQAGSALLGVTLLSLSLSAVHALPVTLPIALLWVFSPLIARALETPASQSIPLTEDEVSLLRSDTQSRLFSQTAGEAHDPGLAMLCTCSACMLGLLEPDEAARRVERTCPGLPGWLASSESDALSRAAVLASAQYLREQMARCDAALRDLPARLEAQVLAAPPPGESSLLARLLRAAMQESSAPLHEGSERIDAAADALFLPRTLLTPAIADEAALPLTHPRTYAKRRALPGGHVHALPDSADSERPALHALCLASSALGHPFRALMLRSPIVAPVAAGLAIP